MKKKAFNFIDGLSELFYSVCGYPTVRFFSDYCEVYFDVTSTIRDLNLLKSEECDSFRMFAGSEKDSITLVYTFEEA